MNIAQTTQETLGLMKESLAKTVTVSTGLTAYDLQAPAKNLYPIITPLRNSLPRVGARSIPATRRAGAPSPRSPARAIDAMGWVPEGQRSASMSYTAPASGRALSDARRGRHGDLRSGGGRQGFEDINATATLRLLQKTMRKEETALLGGNASLALGTPAAPSLAPRGTGATLPAATYSVIVVALELRRLSQLERRRRRRHDPRRSPATTATPIR